MGTEYHSIRSSRSSRRYTVRAICICICACPLVCRFNVRVEHTDGGCIVLCNKWKGGYMRVNTRNRSKTKTRSALFTDYWYWYCFCCYCLTALALPCPACYLAWCLTVYLNITPPSRRMMYFRADTCFGNLLALRRLSLPDNSSPSQDLASSLTLKYIHQNKFKKKRKYIEKYTKYTEYLSIGSR